MRTREPMTALGPLLGLFREELRNALVDVLAEVRPAQPERLLTRDGVCELLAISRSKLDAMIAADPAFPRLRVGSVDRFERSAVLEHFRQLEAREEAA